MKNIVWIASYPKSGNTWIRSIISSAIFGKLDLNELSFQIGSFSNSLESVLKFKKQLTSKGEIRKYWKKSQEQICKNLGNQKIFLKTHNLAANYDGEFFPSNKCTYKAIYIVRDPRDVSISFSYHYNVSLKEAVNNLLDEKRFLIDEKNFSKNEFISSWNNHVNSWKYCEFPVLYIRYEDLLKSPETIYLRLFDFLNIKPIIDLKEILHQTNFKHLQELEEKHGFIESPRRERFFRKGISRSWESVDNSVFNKLVDNFKSTMRKFNYL